MRKEVKGTVVEKLSDYLAQYPHFYLADIEALDAVKTAELRAVCNKENVKLVVVKNTLMRKALAESETDFAELYGALKGNTCVMFTRNANAPARIIKEFAKANKELGKPALKAAYAQESIYLGPENLEALVSIKSKEELVAEVVALLQSPAKNLISALQGAGQTIHGVLKTLEER